MARPAAAPPTATGGIEEIFNEMRPSLSGANLRAAIDDLYDEATGLPR